MKIVKNIQKLSHEIVVYAKDGRKSHLTLHWSAENVKIDKTNFSLRNTIPLHGMNKWRAMLYGSCLNADKHSPASSARSTKRWVSGMLMSVGVESSHWQIAKRLRSWASSEADCECPLYGLVWRITAGGRVICMEDGGKCNKKAEGRDLSGVDKRDCQAGHCLFWFVTVQSQAKF